MNPKIYSASNLSCLDQCSHAFFGRPGGQSKDSKGRSDDFNTGFLHAEDPEEVLINRAVAMEKLQNPPPLLVTPKQVHSTTVYKVFDSWDNQMAPEGDGVVTNVPGLAMGVLTADCGPLLFVDPVHGVIGAAHAGWRGAEAGITGKTIEAMESLGAVRESIHAALGPCIAQKSYEVGPNFPIPFLAKTPDHKKFFAPSQKPGHWMFDMKGFIKFELDNLGLASVEISPEDTCADDENFFSHRYNTLNSRPEFGRQLSVICLI
jgi:YfiH family protein